MNFCQDMSSWEREIDFDTGSVDEVKKECWVSLNGEAAQPPTRDLRRRCIRRKGLSF